MNKKHVAANLLVGYAYTDTRALVLLSKLLISAELVCSSFTLLKARGEWCKKKTKSLLNKTPITQSICFFIKSGKTDILLLKYSIYIIM